MENQRIIPVEWLPQYTYQDYEAWEGDWELIEGVAYSLLPSPKRTHQATNRRFMRMAEDALGANKSSCNCEVFFELDWIINNSTVVRPDAMIVCGKFEDDFLKFPPSLVVEITSRRTQMIDRNVKYKLYESQKVPYYIIADPERKMIETFQLKNDVYALVDTTTFSLGAGCVIQMKVSNLWP